MVARRHPITAAARAALTTHATHTGQRTTITTNIGPDAWRAVKDVMTRLGARHARGTSSFDMPPGVDAATVVREALTVGSVMAPSASEGFVPTPRDLAADLVAEYLELSGRAPSVLEPSAGTGPFVDAVLAAHPDARVTAVEANGVRAWQITDDPRVTTVVDTFERFAERGARFDRIVANPPFSVPGHPTMWAEHLLLAWRMLAPGGRLVAIVPATALSSLPRFGRFGQAMDLIRRHGGGVELERDAFKESGTMIPTAVVWLDRLPVPVSDTRTTQPRRNLVRAYTGSEARVSVDRPFFTREAAASMPVQVMRDAYRGADRVMRYVGDCVCCGRPTWAFDDGENDPRGPLGDHAADPFWPEEYGKVGPAVAACFLCTNDDYETYRRGLAAAEGYWSAPVDALPVAV